jgi:hypothetical protein
VPARWPETPARWSSRFSHDSRWARGSRWRRDGSRYSAGPPGPGGADLDAGVAQILTDRGWRADGHAPVSPMQAHGGARATLDPLEMMAGGIKEPDPALLERLARATLLGVAEPA